MPAGQAKSRRRKARQASTCGYSCVRLQRRDRRCGPRRPRRIRLHPEPLAARSRSAAPVPSVCSIPGRAIAKIRTRGQACNEKEDALTGALQSFAAVLFDFDGTLADSYAAIAASVNHVRAHSVNEVGGVDRRSGTGAPIIELPTDE